MAAAFSTQPAACGRAGRGWSLSLTRVCADPRGTRIDESVVATFIAGELEENIESVPGIGPAAAALLVKVPSRWWMRKQCMVHAAHVCVVRCCMCEDGQVGVHNTYQFLGAYLSLRTTGAERREVLALHARVT